MITSFNGIDFRVFLYAPVYPVPEGLSTLTDIIKPAEGIGSEQRISTRSVPRQSFKHDYYLQTQKQQAAFEALLFGWSKKTFGLPIWIEKELHTSAININDTSITVDTTTSDYRDDSLAIIWSSATNFEVVQIDTVSDNALTLALPVEKNFTGNKWLMPLRLAQITAAVDGKHPDVADIRQVTINFAVKDNVLLTGFTPDVTYKDLPVLNIPHKFEVGSGKQISIDSDSQLQDYDSGDFDYYSDSGFNLITHNFGFIKETKSDIWDFRLFLHSLKGMQGTCWIPTYRADLIQKATISAAAVTFNIENIGLADNMGVNTLRTHLAFIFPDGSHIYREITGITEVDENQETITINSALGVEVAVGDCYISFLDCCRRSSDDVEIEHIIWNKIKCVLTFIATPYSTFTESSAGNYPTLQVADGTFEVLHDDPGLAHTLAVSSLTDLNNIRNNLSGNYYLTADIDASETSGWNGGEGWIPIGTTSVPFTGTFDGCGFTISGLTMNYSSGYDGYGLFGEIDSPGLVANLIMENISITGYYYVGGIAGYISSSNNSLVVHNCHISGVITGDTEVGGIVGHIYGGEFDNPLSNSNITDNISDCIVTGYAEVGGFVGYANSAKISNCRALGNVTGDDFGISGFVGRVYGSTFEDCCSDGDVEGYGLVAGFFGACGYNYWCTGGYGHFLRCRAVGDVAATGEGGWLCAGFGCDFTDSEAEDCYAWGNVTAVDEECVTAGFIANVALPS